MFKFLLATLLITIVISQDAQNLQCADAVPGCANCSDSQKCLTCDTGKGYKSAAQSQGTQCTCAPGFFLRGVKCQLCAFSVFGCNECTLQEGVKCDSCVDTTIVLNRSLNISPCSSTCQDEKNMIGCKECTGETCTKCSRERNFTIEPNATTNNCYCQLGYGLIPSTKFYCLPCSHLIPGCRRCNSESECNLCDEQKKFIKNQETKICDCIQGYIIDVNTTSFWNISNCTACVEQQFCKICTAVGCAECDVGYGYNESILCQKCTVVGCTDCDRVNSCTNCDADRNFVLYGEGDCKCDEGYFLTGGEYLFPL